MANVTDAAFRRIIAKYGKPDVMWTEFVSVDGLWSAGREALLVDLRYDPSERPIVAQFFGSDPELFRRTAALAAELGFDGIDINMGCPDRGVEKGGSGAALIRNPELAVRLIRAAKGGAGGLPVSVKTRIGYNEEAIDSWLSRLLAEGPAALTVHLRTRKEMSDVAAHWEVMPRIVALRNRVNPGVPVLGNGDVQSLAEAAEKCAETGADGVMIGRGIFGNPWCFARPEARPDLGLRLSVMLEHTRLFEELLGAHKNFDIMKKHYKAYVSGFDGAKELRVKLMEAKSADEVGAILETEGYAVSRDGVER